MCPTSYPRKGLCKAVNCSISNNPITTCLKVGLLLPYSVVGRVKILSGQVNLGYTSQVHSPEIGITVLHQMGRSTSVYCR